MIIYYLIIYNIYIDIYYKFFDSETHCSVKKGKMKLFIILVFAVKITHCKLQSIVDYLQGKHLTPNTHFKFYSLGIFSILSLKIDVNVALSFHLGTTVKYALETL